MRVTTLKKLILSSLLGLFLFTPLLQSDALALELKGGDKSKIVVLDENVRGNYMAAAERIEIYADVDGDLYLTGSEIIVSGNVNGNLYASGGLITISGYVGKSVFAAGGDIAIQGEVSRNVYATGGQVVVDGNVHEDLIIFGGDSRVRGDVDGDVVSASGLLYLEGKIGGDLLASGGSILIGDNVGGDAIVVSEDLRINADQIGGDLTVYTATKNYKPEDGVVVGGEFRRMSNHFDDGDLDLGVSFSALGILFGLVNLVGMILLGIILLRFMPVKLNNSVSMLETARDWVINGVYGVIAMIVVFLVGLMLLISVVGWPILGFMVGLTIIVCYLSSIVVAIRVGNALLRGKKNSVWSLVAGLLLIHLFTAIPFLGFVLTDIVAFVGIGAVLRAKIQYLNRSTVEVVTGAKEIAPQKSKAGSKKRSAK